jgi:hypothetical protein
MLERASGNSSFALASLLHGTYSASLAAYATVLLGVLSRDDKTSGWQTIEREQDSAESKK